MEDTEGRKPHRMRHSGPKAEKKKSKSQHDQELSAKQRNPKAFAYHSVNKVARQVRRTLDIKEKKHHIPVVDRTPVEPPPIVVAVVGPPKVGKTTLINCLIKNFTRTKLSTIQGPVTIVSGKKRRLTFVESNNDINCMIDLAKIADLVLLLVDASFGFEMETFEFLNICQVHGFPKIMGVLTHLDHFRDNKHLRKTKKRLKHRFWTEIYQGAKLFYLSGMVNGEYQKTEIHNLGRFISVMKFRPLQWRTTHPYVLADRMEDVTDPEEIRQNAKCDRSVCLYGYVRGTHFRNKSNIHIAGCGDFNILDMSCLPDPCGLPDNEKKRSLNLKERLIYAPFSGVGGIVYDKDAVYIDLGGSHSHNQDESKPSNELMSSIIDSQQTLDSKMAASKMTLFKDTVPLTSEEIDSTIKFNMPNEETVNDKDGRTRRRAVFGESATDSGAEDSEDEEDDEIEEDEEEASDDEEDKKTQPSSAGPISKKQKLDTKCKTNLAFADSDDELETDHFQVFSQAKQASDTRGKNKDTERPPKVGKTDVKKDTKTLKYNVENVSGDSSSGEESKSESDEEESSENEDDSSSNDVDEDSNESHSQDSIHSNRINHKQCDKMSTEKSKKKKVPTATLR